jgi:hypothetical protein
LYLRKIGHCSKPHLHDVGYSPVVSRTGIHQLDGAAYLRQRGYERLARPVAHHSEARFEIEVRGLLHMLAQYKPENQQLQDALTYCVPLRRPLTRPPTRGGRIRRNDRPDSSEYAYCDLTTSATGERISVEARLADVERRYKERKALPPRISWRLWPDPGRISKQLFQEWSAAFARQADLYAMTASRPSRWKSSRRRRMEGCIARAGTSLGSKKRTSEASSPARRLPPTTLQAKQMENS